MNNKSIQNKILEEQKKYLQQIESKKQQINQKSSSFSQKENLEKLYLQNKQDIEQNNEQNSNHDDEQNEYSITEKAVKTNLQTNKKESLSNIKKMFDEKNFKQIDSLEENIFQENEEDIMTSDIDPEELSLLQKTILSKKEDSIPKQKIKASQPINDLKLSGFNPKKDIVRESLAKNSFEKNVNHQYNPLLKHFRKPGISIRLPTNLLYYDSDDINVAPNGEVEIFPLSLRDELYLKNPDSLNNGETLKKIIHSCCPSIKNVEKLLNPDLDAILIGMRICSYGKNMDIETKCPKCNSDNFFSVDLVDVLDKTNFMEEIPSIKFENENLEIFLKPHGLFSNIKLADFAFEQAKISSLLADNNFSDEQKLNLLNELSDKVVELQELLILDSIYFVKVDDEIVDNKKYIEEWVKNAPSNILHDIEEKMIEINNKYGIQKEFNLICQNCNHTWNSKLTYDPTSFFKKNF